MTVWKPKVKCTYKGKYYSPENPNDIVEQDKRPTKHFEKMGRATPEPVKKVLDSDDPETMFEMQLRDKNVNQIKNYIEDNYHGVTMVIGGKKKEDVIAEALKIIRDDNIKRKAAGDIGK